MKKYQLIGILLVFIVLLILGCKNSSKKKFDSAEAKASIEARGKVFVDAFNKGDSVGLANCYTKDAKFMQPNGKSIAWRENIQKLFGQWMKAGVPKFSMKTIDVWGNAEALAAEEEWTMTDKEGKIIDSGKSIEIFKKEDGVWKLYRDCYNSDLPCPK
ncbi:YybH family protein [Flavobacterium sp.]|uniref:YybH family protein n=1 Tax=Flavobacterium sp. TaxID=239 RepID=UPI003D6BE3DE